jgi:uncharacterized protein (TIGR02246 family)
MNESQAVALVAGVEAAWNAHDMTRFAECFSEEADFVNVGGWWWRGRQEIEQNHAVLHSTLFKDSTMSLQLAAYKQVSPKIAVVHVKWVMEGHAQSGVEQTADARLGIWSWVTRVRDGRAEIVSAHNTDTWSVPTGHPLAHLTPR